ncbi:MAG: glycosyltransferase family 2 protein, partial [Endomicrobium sp.]|nr:glycosyltransferase family 2 protein [Endomicrobium sp.]
MGILLSISIPTYNKAGYLRIALDSIFEQIDNSIKDKVEVCVSDDASDDETDKIVGHYRRLYKNLIYFRWDKNNGAAGKNFFKAVEISSGKFCWLIGGDDLLEPNSIKYMLNEFQQNPDIDLYWANINLYDIDNNIIPNKDSGIYKHDIIFNNSRDAMKHMGTHFGQITSLIFNTDRWKDAKNKEYYYKYSYPQLYPLFTMLKNGSKLKYLSTRLGGYRYGNSAFFPKDTYKRFHILISEHDRITKDIFGKNSPEAEIINKLVMKHHIFPTILYFVKLSPYYSISFQLKAFKLLCRTYWMHSFFYLYMPKIMFILFCPAFILKFICFI